MKSEIMARAEMVCLMFTLSVAFLVPGIVAIRISNRLERRELEKAARENPDHYLNVLKRGESTSHRNNL
jgi:hypothetical protein